jgi:hypothetical protein
MVGHYRFVPGSSPRGSTLAGSKLIPVSNVLHCDKASWFRHIEALSVLFVVQALIVSDDNGLIRRWKDIGRLFGARLVPAFAGI